MFTKMLVPLDGSQTAESVIPCVAALAGGLGISVTLLHVASNLPARGSAAEPLPQSYLQEVGGRLARGGVRQMERREVSGEAAVEILHFAEEHGYDVIAMATHGRSGITRWMLGSVADRVLQAAGIPVLLVRAADGAPAEAALRNLVVPLDGSALAESALPLAEGLAKGLKLPIVLTRVVPLARVVTGFETMDFDPNWDAEMEKAAEDYLRPVSQRLQQAGIQASHAVKRGDPAVQIIESVKGMPGSLIVMSSHGRSGITRWAFGSVADRVLRASAAPVLMLRAGPDARE